MSGQYRENWKRLRGIEQRPASDNKDVITVEDLANLETPLPSGAVQTDLATSTSGNIAIFVNSSGNRIEDSGVAITDIAPSGQLSTLENTILAIQVFS